MNETSSKRQQELMDELSRLGNMIRGSLVHTTRKCGRKTCSCAHGGPGHPVCLLSTSTVMSRNRMTYVSKETEETAAAGVAEYKRVREIIVEINSLNLASLKNQVSSASHRCGKGGTLWNYGTIGVALPRRFVPPFRACVLFSGSWTPKLASASAATGWV